MIDLLLRNATLSDGQTGVSLAVDRGRWVDLGQNLNAPARDEIDLEGCLAVPGFVEPHLHLDIALMNSAVRPGRVEPFLSVGGLNAALERRRAGFTAQDIEDRAGAAIKLAVRHGITAIRAQCHVDAQVGLRHLEALLRVKEKFAGQMRLQIVAFPQQGLRGSNRELFREAFSMGADVMGCAPNLDRDETGQTDFRRHIDTALALAMQLDVDLDVHADLGLPEQIGLDDLEVVYLARRVLETGFDGRRVVAAHVCALDSALPAAAEQAIALVRESQISIISQPDLYRLGRADQHHVRRGLTRVKQFLRAGVNVALASNNVRDVMRPLGNLNPLEEALVLAYGAHMDTVEELGALLSMCTVNAARAIRLPEYGLEPGCQADLVVLEASTPSAAVAGQAEKRYVFKMGRLVATNRVINRLY
jgi:cytosine/creatinine deaminase